MIDDNTYIKINSHSEFCLFKENIKKIFNFKKLYYFSRIENKKIGVCKLDLYTTINFPKYLLVRIYKYNNIWELDIISKYSTLKNNYNYYNYYFQNDEEIMESFKNFKITKDIGVL